MLKRWYQRVDLLLILSVAGLLAMGLVALYSSSHSISNSANTTNYFKYQLMWILVGTAILGVIYFLPNKLIYDFAYVVYILSIILLIAVLFFGSTGSGAQRWLRLGPIRFQPSEFAKIAVLLAVARYLSKPRLDINRFRPFAIASLIFLLPFILIVRQPDMGTSIAFLALVLPVYFWAGLESGKLFLLVAPFIVLIASFNFYFFVAIMLILLIYLYLSHRPFLNSILIFAINIFVGLSTPFLWNHLQEYQQRRIKIFINPEADPLGAGYQIIQSKVAIGSGGLLGKGFLHGSQTQLRFLPEQHTDFIFAVIGEEFGFLGAIIGLTLFAILLISIIYIASLQKSRFNGIVTIGIAALIGFHMLVNVGMTVGLFPVTGLPLPFISYGGSSLITAMTAVGL
ncbi:MAG: rod shape-determining protein RodA, partial [Calditrichia bacterium]